MFVFQFLVPSLRDTCTRNKRGKRAAIVSGFTQASPVTSWQLSIPYINALLTSHVLVRKLTKVFLIQLNMTYTKKRFKSLRQNFFEMCWTSSPQQSSCLPHHHVNHTRTFWMNMGSVHYVLNHTTAHYRSCKNYYLDIWGSHDHDSEGYWVLGCCATTFQWTASLSILET
jgi:hypothetical protein